MAAKDGLKDESWIATQSKTFTKWVNNHLKKKNFPQIENPTTAFVDGIALINIVNGLYSIPIPKYNAKPKSRHHQLDNINMALGMVEAAKIKTNFLKNNHLVDQDQKMILGMIWAIILDYAIKGISVDDLTAKEGLLLWCRKKTAGYRDIDPPGLNNFSTDWKNGLAFCALIHRHRPDLLDYNSLDKGNAAHNLELAFSIAEKELDISRLLDVSDLTDTPKPDEHSVMTYVSEYFHRFASQDIRENAAKRVLKFLKFAQGIESQVGFNNANFGDSLESAKAAFDQLKAYVTGDKPQKAGEKLDLELLFAEIQTELRVNNRASYVAKDGLSPEDLEIAWDGLGASEKAYAKQLRDFRFTFIKKVEEKVPEEKIQEFEDSFAHFDADKDGVLERLEFKAACVAIGVPFKDEEAYNKLFTQLCEGNPTLSKEQYFRYLIARSEDRDDPQSVKDSFSLIADGNASNVTAQQLRVPPLNDDDIGYITTRAPQVGDGVYDYVSFVDKSFL